MKRVVITGASIISSLADNIPDLWENISNGKHGISDITRFDTSNINTRVACEIKDFDAEKYGITIRETKRMDLCTQYGVAAANMAMEDSNTDFSDIDPFRCGVIVGTGIGGVETTLNEQLKCIEKTAKRVSPMFIPTMIPNMPSGMIAMKLGFKGSNFSLASACATSTHCIGEAFRHIKHGYEDVMVAGGAENPIIELAVAGFDNMKALTRSTDPDRASIPFDMERSGFVIAEGASVLILEELEHAKKRGAHIYAEIVGYGATDDAYHITSPAVDGSGSARAMQNAIDEAGITPKDVDYINAHGTSTLINDKVESLAIKLAFGEDLARKVAISSSKSMIGHMMGAAGSAEALICAIALENGMIPPTAGFKIADPDCDLDYVTNGARKQDINYAISNSLGFGGHNATLCFKKYVG